MRGVWKRQLELTRRRMDSLREYAREHANIDAIEGFARKYGNVTTLRQFTTAPKSIGRKFVTSTVIALSSILLAFLLASVPPLSGSVQKIDEAIYDSFYKHRPPESKYDGEVVMVVVDQSSIERMAASKLKFGWPWPREIWGTVISWLEKCGARAVVLDLRFEEPSFYQTFSTDDENFALSLDNATVPTVIAKTVREDGRAPFALPVHRQPNFAAVNTKAGIQREYMSGAFGVNSMAIEALRATKQPVPQWANQSFLLHYYGPSRRADGKTTFSQIPALEVFLASHPDSPPMPNITPALFKGKIVIIGATADGTNDLKNAPIQDIFPGTEIQATAITNLLENRRVRMLGWITTLAVSFLAAIFASSGAVMPKKAAIKLIVPILAISTAFLTGYLLFVRFWEIYWLRLAVPLLATVFATVGALAWTYLVEDRQRRTLRKFLAQYVSPEVAEELDRRGTISLGGVERDLSLVFTDIAGFTDLTEQLPVDQLERFMNYYLSEMSDVVFAAHGTLDKYIGDAIMTFWNAPLDQPDHAIRACHAALGMANREKEIRPILKQMGAGDILTRIGINTARVKVGNYGSLQKLNYTALGDGVNLASRLEGANKMYGTQILVAQPTVDVAKSQFLFRKLDLLRVKGKKVPMPVYELVAEGAGDEQQQKLAVDFEAALAAYQKQDWDKSAAKLIAILEYAPDDGPANEFLDRVKEFRSHPPPPDWDGVHVAKSK